MIRVKICGITNEMDAWVACAAGADALGFVFTKSPRRVSLETAKKITQKAGPFISTVGVFVNESVTAMMRAADACKLSALQLHGDEKPALLRRLKKAPVKIIKAFRIGPDFDFKCLDDHPADAFLFDAFESGRYGGTGKVFSWEYLRKIEIKTPWIVSGGLRPDNVRELLKICEPYAVDVSSGVENKPGSKDEFLIRKFIQNVKTR